MKRLPSAGLLSTVVVASCAISLPSGHTFQLNQLTSPSFRCRGHVLAPLRRLSPSLAESSSETSTTSLDPEICSQFSIRVCGSTACNRRRAQFGLDEFQTLGNMYDKAEEAGVSQYMVVEDGPCHGGKNCKLGPCVSVQHEDYEGNVALEGMKSAEFTSSVFHNVVTHDDVGRVWNCVENAVRLMAEAEEDEED